MTAADLKILCAALGFTVIAMQGEDAFHKESAQRAVVLAQLIKEFCRATVPHAFGVEGNVEDTEAIDKIDALIGRFKAERSRNGTPGKAALCSRFEV